MNIKGEISTLTKIIAILITLIVLLLVLDPLLTLIKSGGAKSNCENWAILESGTKVVGAKLTDLNSPCITTSEALTGNKDKVNEKLADNLFTCWDQYGGGKLDFYSDWGDWNSIDKHCRICSEIVVGENIKTDGIDIDDFEIYLGENTPKYNPKSYAEIFTETDNAKIDFGQGFIPLKEDQTIYSIYSITKLSDNFYDRFIDGSLFVVGSTGAIATGCGAVALASVGSLFVPCVVGGFTIATIGYAVIEPQHKSVFIPSLDLIPGDNVEQIKEVCGGEDANIYYKPEKKFEFKLGNDS